MNNIWEIIKKAGLFLFGVVLIIWGYRANASTGKVGALPAKSGFGELLNSYEEELNAKAEELKPEPKKVEPVKVVKTQVAPEKKPEIATEPQTVVEKETPEESSATQ